MHVPHAAGFDSFGFSISKSLTAASTSIQMDLAGRRGVEDEDQRSDSRLFGTVTGRYDKYDLY